MTTGLVKEADGLFIGAACSFSNALSAAPAGSTHWTLHNGIYNLWATQPCVVFVTDAGHDPAALPAALGAELSYPGSPIPAGMVFQFQFDSSFQVDVSTVLVTPTGIRVWTLGAAGTFYLTELQRRTL